MNIMLLLFTLYTVASIAADKTTPECRLRYIDSKYGTLCTKRQDDGFHLIIKVRGVEIPVKECDGFVSISATESMSFDNVTKAVREKMGKHGRLYYKNTYLQLSDISNEKNLVFDFDMMQKSDLDELGRRLFFVAQRECRLRYIDSKYGTLCTQWMEDGIHLCIKADGLDRTPVKECDGYVSIETKDSMTFDDVTKAVRGKMGKQGQLYYIDAFHQLWDISNKKNGCFDFGMMQKSDLDELGRRLFFVVERESSI